MTLDRLWNGSCEETGQHLSEHLDEELRWLRRLRVSRHLARCELCRAVLLSLTRTVEQLRILGRLDPPSPTVADAVLIRIRHEEAGG